MKHFRNNKDRAAAYAAYRELERMLDEDGEFPPGFSQDVSNAKISITIPKGTTISRDPGLKNDGIIEKSATQNLYGWFILSECLRVASKFKQHLTLKRILLMIVRRAVNKGISSEKSFRELMPVRAKEIESIKDSFKLPKRQEKTPRLIIRENDKLLPTIVVSQ